MVNFNIHMEQEKEHTTTIRKKWLKKDTTQKRVLDIVHPVQGVVIHDVEGFLQELDEKNESPWYDR